MENSPRYQNLVTQIQYFNWKLTEILEWQK